MFASRSTWESSAGVDMRAATAVGLVSAQISQVNGVIRAGHHQNRLVGELEHVPGVVAHVGWSEAR